MRRLALILWLWPSLLAAQGFPGLYDVTGVAGDDVLNIRAAPSASADIIGSYAPHETNIEVVAQDGNWLQVNVAEMSGWISASFAQRTGPDWIEGLPENLACYGTEPFWSFDEQDGMAVFNLPLGEFGARYTRSPAATIPFGLQPVEFSAVYFGDYLSIATASIRRESCGDGMSDRNMGLSLLLTLIEGDGVSVYSGCCSLAP